MNKIKLDYLKGLGAAALIALGLIVLSLFAPVKSVAQTDSQGQPQTFVYPTGLPTNIAAGQTSNTTSVIKLRKGQGAALAWTYNGATNVSMTVLASVDGTNYFPFATVSQTNTLASTTTTNIVSLGTNWSSATLAGFYSLEISAMAETGTIALTNKNPSTPVIVNLPNG